MSHEFTFFWFYDPKAAGEATAECTLNYIPKCLGHGSHPDEPESCELLDVTVGGQSIVSLLNIDQVNCIQDLALERHGQDQAEAAAEAQYDRWQARSYG